MDQRELTRLKNLADALVEGRPVVAKVGYDRRASRLTLHLQSAPNATARKWASRECSPTRMDHVDLDAYVRREVAEFVAQLDD